jgi:hypothetical protein
MQINRILRDHHQLARTLLDDLSTGRLSEDERHSRYNELHKLLVEHLRIERELVDPLLSRAVVLDPAAKTRVMQARVVLQEALDDEDSWEILGGRVRDYFALEEKALLPAFEETLDPQDAELLGARAHDLEASEHRT